uniref:hypothetical protein n=1 Tax=Enterobacter hormaechei TaxID=158836 RepID=UPI001952D293
VVIGGRREKIVVLGGLAEISAKGLTVLADVATSVTDIDRVQFAKTVAQMEAEIAKAAQGSQLDREIERLDHFKTVLQHLEGTAMH